MLNGLFIGTKFNQLRSTVPCKNLDKVVESLPSAVSRDETQTPQRTARRLSCIR